MSRSELYWRLLSLLMLAVAIFVAWLFKVPVGVYAGIAGAITASILFWQKARETREAHEQTEGDRR